MTEVMECKINCLERTKKFDCLMQIIQYMKDIVLRSLECKTEDEIKDKIENYGLNFNVHQLVYDILVQTSIGELTVSYRTGSLNRIIYIHSQNESIGEFSMHPYSKFTNGIYFKNKDENINIQFSNDYSKVSSLKHNIKYNNVPIDFIFKHSVKYDIPTECPNDKLYPCVLPNYHISNIKNNKKYNDIFKKLSIDL
jgi:hypothetical protein